MKFAASIYLDALKTQSKVISLYSTYLPVFWANFWINLEKKRQLSTQRCPVTLLTGTSHDRLYKKRVSANDHCGGDMLCLSSHWTG